MSTAPDNNCESAPIQSLLSVAQKPLSIRRSRRGAKKISSPIEGEGTFAIIEDAKLTLGEAVT